ncbi:FAD-dependent oxidoreductase [Massilia sp. TSP1-1-2]|uniref:FAD-dependent oxidoreductase n=1 Tax=Massilia sp. TSP1-1-2 TaxID=2804649 RepID=UPI003CE895DE
MNGPIVIVGAGMAAYGVARELRKLDKATPLIIVAGDSAGAYAKPMLSNAIALGKAAHQLVSHSAAQMAVQLDATVLAHTRVLAIDTAASTLRTDQGEVVYGKLVLALGADPIRLPMAGDAAAEVLSVNHVDDYAQMRARLEQVGKAARVTIIGAGLIGCEFADDLLAGGHHVTLVDPNLQPLGALAAPSLAAGLAQAWHGRSLSLRLGTTVAGVARTADGLLVTLADGGAVTADLVLSAVGLRPAIALAQAAGLATGRGIVVDAYGKTSADGVYALGDCAEYAGVGVLPYVAPLLTAARAIAATLAGTPTPIVHKKEAVIVKTPSYKLALAPPAAGIKGSWVDEIDGERTIARFVDEQGKLHGFGISAHTPALRQKLQGEIG